MTVLFINKRIGMRLHDYNNAFLAILRIRWFNLKFYLGILKYQVLCEKPISKRTNDINPPIINNGDNINSIFG